MSQTIVKFNRKYTASQLAAALGKSTINDTAVVDGTIYIAKDGGAQYIGASNGTSIVLVKTAEVETGETMVSRINSYQEGLGSTAVAKATVASELENAPSLSTGVGTTDSKKISVTAGGKSSSLFTVPFATEASTLSLAPVLAAGTTDTNAITVAAGGQTSLEFTVPYATNAGTATNLAAKPALAAGTTDANAIKVTAGGKTSDEFTVPYATKAAQDASGNVITSTYRTISDSYTKSEVNDLVNAAKLPLIAVTTLPEASASTMGAIYLVPSTHSVTSNVKDEWVTVRSGSENSYTYAWEQIGSTTVDLSGYKTKQTAKSDVATSGNASASEVIVTSVTQNENGEVTVTRKTANWKPIQAAITTDPASSGTAAYDETLVTSVRQDANGVISVTRKAANYKTRQSAVTDPTASESGVAGGAYVDSVTQNANGEITVSRKKLPDYSSTYKAIQTAVTDSAASTSGSFGGDYVESVTQNTQGVITVTKKKLPTTSGSVGSSSSATDAWKTVVHDASLSSAGALSGNTKSIPAATSSNDGYMTSTQANNLDVAVAALIWEE